MSVSISPLLLTLTVCFAFSPSPAAAAKATRAWHVKIDVKRAQTLEWWSDEYRDKNILAHIIGSHNAVGDARVGECPAAIATVDNEMGDFHDGTLIAKRKFERNFVYQVVEVFDRKWCLYPTSDETALVFAI